MENIQCDRCKKDIKPKEINYITLYGTDDFYNLEVCNECQYLLMDYYSPAQIDEMFK